MSPKSVLITGASRGLGLEFVKQILSQTSPPEFLLATCRNPSKADELQAIAKGNGRIKIIKMDVTKDDEIKAAFEETRRILGDCGLNLLINNAAIHSKETAGVADAGTLESQTRERLQSHFDTNTTAPVLIVKEFLPLLKTAAEKNSSLSMGSSKAAVVNISSVMGSVEETLKSNIFNRYHYRATKCALNMLTATMANELKGLGILVVPIHPGWVKTDMGGPQGDLEKSVSIENCWSTISSLSEESFGKLINYDGKVIPW